MNGGAPNAAFCPGDDLSRTIGHIFKRPALLTEALTHRSALHHFPGKRRSRKPARTYERLEFLGDRVLGLVVADLLWRQFPAAPEGELTRRYHDLVQGPTLTRVAEAIGLGPHLILSPSEAAAARNPGILADACEAVIAAIYIDGGYKAAFAFVERWWTPLLTELGDRPQDAKTRLQEWAQARGLGLPAYRVTATEGPSHAPRFTVAAQIGQSEAASATASSKRAAETEAAAALLERLAGDG